MFLTVKSWRLVGAAALTENSLRVGLVGDHEEVLDRLANEVNNINTSMTIALNISPAREYSNVSNLCTEADPMAKAARPPQSP